MGKFSDGPGPVIFDGAYRLTPGRPARYSRENPSFLGDWRMSRIGELLVREKMLSLQQLQQAQDEAKRSGKRLGVTLAKLGYVQDQELTQFVARQYSLPAINLGDVEIDPAVLKLVPREIAEKHQVIPVKRAGSTLIVAMADPSNIYAIDELKFLTQYNIDPVVASDGALEQAISRYYD